MLMWAKRDLACVVGRRRENHHFEFWERTGLYLLGADGLMARVPVLHVVAAIEIFHHLPLSGAAERLDGVVLALHACVKDTTRHTHTHTHAHTQHTHTHTHTHH